MANGTHPVPPELVEMVRDVLARRGPQGAARVLGISRSTVLAVAAGLPVTNGSLAILRAAHQRRNEAA